MMNISTRFAKERSIFACKYAGMSAKKTSEELAKAIYDVRSPPSNWNDEQYQIANWKEFFNRLSSQHSKACTAPIKTNEIDKFAKESVQDNGPKCPISSNTIDCPSTCGNIAINLSYISNFSIYLCIFTVLESCKNFQNALIYAYARKIYDEYSITPEGAKGRNFHLHDFSRMGFFYAIGIFDLFSIQL